MEAKLFDRLKESMQQFNVGDMLDIPTGKFLNGGLNRGDFVVHAAFPNKTGPNYTLISKWMVELEKLKPNTPERWLAAGRLLQYMGYTVTWKGDECPDVHWINTEGNAEDEAKMIDDFFNRDYLSEPRLDLSHLSGDVAYAKMQEMLNCWTKPAIICDSISQDSTEKS